MSVRQQTLLCFHLSEGWWGRAAGPRQGTFPAAVKRPWQIQVWSQNVTQSPTFLRCGLRAPRHSGLQSTMRCLGKLSAQVFRLSIFNIKPTTKCWVSVQGMAFRLIHCLAASPADSNPPAEGPSRRLQFQTNFVEPLSFFSNIFPSHYMTIH